MQHNQSVLNKKLVTIIVPNYKTLDITKICMRLLRQYTDLNQADIVVVDNHSADASLDYLKSLTWIKLIERTPIKDEPVYLAHSRALDLALQTITTPYVLSIHTDTFIKDAKWLDVLLAPFEANSKLAGVGSWKLESKTQIQLLGHKIEQFWKFTLSKLFSYQGYRKNRFDINARYLRSHCAMYKTDIIKALNTGFSDEEDAAGRAMHKKMVAAGYDMLFLGSAHLGRYVDHLNHATMVLNPELGSSERSVKQGYKRIKQKLRGIDADKILANHSLDD